MRRPVILNLLLAVTAGIQAQVNPHTIDSLCNVLSIETDRIDDIDARHLTRIAVIKDAMHSQRLSTPEAIAINDQLIEAYYKFNYDSALTYMNRNIELASRHGLNRQATRLLLRKATLYAKAGNYLEAVHIVKSFDSERLADSLQADYYNACKNVYGEAGHYSTDSTLHHDYEELTRQYNRRLISLLDTTTADYMQLREHQLRNEGRLDEALEYNTRQLALTDTTSAKFSEVAFFRSWTYQLMGNREMEKYWLLRSAINDVRCSIKDQASLWTLADRLSEEGNVELSYKLIAASQEGLRQYNTPLRNMQSASVLNVVGHNYHLLTEKRNHQLRWSLGIISVLALLLAAAMAYVYRQMKRLAHARAELHQANLSLTDLNQQLNEAVEQLNLSNGQLNDSNRIKDVYIGRFLALCSSYMKKMDAFRITVMKKARSGQLADYLATDRIRETSDRELAELMDDFDKAFLHIFPTFLDDFNALLQPEARISPPRPGQLTTELRIFALIRLGITDSSKIAEFLHYSVHTIYNYRSMVKNNALGDREQFEAQVKRIGSHL